MFYKNSISVSTNYDKDGQINMSVDAKDNNGFSFDKKYTGNFTEIFDEIIKDFKNQKQNNIETKTSEEENEKEVSSKEENGKKVTYEEAYTKLSKDYSQLLEENKTLSKKCKMLKANNNQLVEQIKEAQAAIGDIDVLLNKFYAYH